jgi:hypothetical protein
VPVKQGDYVFCTREDKLNLVEKWKEGRRNYLFVNTTQDLMDADLTMVKYSTQPNMTAYEVKQCLHFPGFNLN